ncbi:ABC transporter substrate-binding protein [Cellulosilyticum sp. ST5]|uniref:ABC transporter substrate-binding protein n=1 Tax=Cellulosilyticum sp. ST5 TaxID=3055805 RepID=UPI0039775719
MKLLKKTLTVFVGTACVLSMALTGCNKPASTDPASPSPSASTSTEASDTPATTEEALAPVELTWYFVGNQQQEDTALVEAEVNKYIAENTKLNCTIKLQCYDWGTYNDRITQMIAAGETFDICFTANWSNNYYTQSAKGAFVPLNDLMDKYAPKTKEILGEDFLSGSRINGVNYAIPANKEKAHSWGLLVRKDIVEKYNMDLSGVKTLADMEPFFQIIKEKEPNMYALEGTPNESAMRILDFDIVNNDTTPGAVYNDDNSKVFDQLEQPETLEHFKLMNSFMQKGYIREDAASVTDYNADQKAGKIFCAVRSLKPTKAEEESNSQQQSYMQIELTSPIISNRETTGSMQAISATSKNPERAMMFLELFNTDPVVNNLINFGIEGTHYTKISDNQIKGTENQAKYNPGLGWAFGNQLINYLTELDPTDKWDQFEAFNAAGVKTQSLGFVFDPAPVTTQIAQCTNVWNEFVPGLQVGSSNPDEALPKAVEAFNAAGMQDILAEMQKQMDAFNAAK